MKYLWSAFFVVFFCFCDAQSITVKIEDIPIGDVSLYGYNRLKKQLIEKNSISQEGVAIFHFQKDDYGFGYLSLEDGSDFLLFLNEEDIEINIKKKNESYLTKIKEGEQNKVLYEYLYFYNTMQQVKPALYFILEAYSNDSAELGRNKFQSQVQQELGRLAKEEANILRKVSKKSELNHYLEIRSLLNQLNPILRGDSSQVKVLISQFRSLDYSKSFILKSGAYGDLLKAQFWLIEETCSDSQIAYNEMRISIDNVISDVKGDQLLLNEVASYLLNYFESKSLFQIAEYLALLLLNADGCIVQTELAMQMESYRAMKIGEIAPNIDFNTNGFLAGRQQSQFGSIDSFQTEFTLVFFGASWCPKCNEELPKIIGKYVDWRNKGLEVLYVSLDSESKGFEKDLVEIPFFSYCDYKSWESDVVESYYVFGTPSYFILNNKREIILKPISAEQVDSWVKTYLSLPINKNIRLKN